MHLKTKLISLLFLIISVINCLKLPENCGKNGLNFDEEISWRIVGGQLCNASEWPWQVALRIDMVFENETIALLTCGGSLINENHVLTAAHCVHTEPDVKSYTVYLGYTNLTQKLGNELKVGVSKIIKHEQFNYELKNHDLALVKLNMTLDFADKHKHLQPVCLPTLKNETTDKCMATGFGYHDIHASADDKSLRKVLEPIYDISKCDQKMFYINKEQNLCAGGLAKGGLGTCKGDSGGPLQCQNKDGKWYQIGITSWGQPCALPDIPDVFTRVAYFRDWIETNLS